MQRTFFLIMRVTIDDDGNNEVNLQDVADAAGRAVQLDLDTDALNFGDLSLGEQASITEVEIQWDSISQTPFGSIMDVARYIEECPPDSAEQ